MHCRENLFNVFKLCCLSLPNRLTVAPSFTIDLPSLTSDNDECKSSIRRVQSSLSGIANVPGLFSNPRTIFLIFTLVERVRALLEDASFSLCDVLSSCSSGRQRFVNKLLSRYICTVSEEEKLWASIHASPKSSGSPNSFGSQLASSRGNFVEPSPFPTKSSGTASAETTQTACLVLSSTQLSVSRVVTDVPFLPVVPSEGTTKLVVTKENSENK